MEVIDERSEIGFLDLTKKRWNAESDETLLAVHLGTSEIIFVNAANLTKISENRFYFQGIFGAVPRLAPDISDSSKIESDARPAQANPSSVSAQTSDQADSKNEIILPVVAEELQVGKRTIETGGVRVHKTVHEEVRTIDEPVIRENLNIERVPVNKFVETAPGVRYEGDVMIVPVLEEVVVTQKHLLLREEIRITKSREEISNPQQITLRREEINFEELTVQDVKSNSPER